MPACHCFNYLSKRRSIDPLSAGYLELCVSLRLGGIRVVVGVLGDVDGAGAEGLGQPVGRHGVDARLLQQGLRGTQYRV